MDLESPLLDRHQAAAYLRHSPRTLRRWVRKGLLTPVGSSRKVFFTRAELDRFLQDGVKHRITPKAKLSGWPRRGTVFRHGA